MTTPITYPPGQIKTWGINQALVNQNTWITYIGVDGSIFYLAGPLAPVPGAQDGVVLIKHMGLMAPFEMLELEGARQDGATWTDAVYGVGEIMLGVEASGIAPQNVRNVVRQWVSAWNPRATGVLSVFTPDLGEWWAPVRLGKNISDIMNKDYTWSGRQPFVWNCKNYDAYWYGLADSTSSFAISYASASEDFTALSDSSTLDANWTQLYDATHVGSCGIVSGAASYIGTTPENVDVLNLYKTGSATDNQVVSLKFGGAPHGFFGLDTSDPITTGSYIDLWARVNSAGTSGIRARISSTKTFFGLITETDLTLSHFNNGVKTDWATISISSPNIQETFSLLAGTEAGAGDIRVQRNGFTILNISDTAGASLVGSAYRGWGWGLGVSSQSGQLVIPPAIASWSAGDNLAATESGYLPLTNIGDVEAWPRYLCYGPGTFAFGNGPGSTSMITFGPLLDGQVVLVTTEPRLRSVVDLSPSQPPQQLNSLQALIEGLISFATNNNTPPLLEQFENLFGVQTPQGNLYSLLNGRFTTPIPGSSYGVAPATQKIAVSITDGSPVSKVVAAITPRRRWPL